jgi:hypothetical protein
MNELTRLLPKFLRLFYAGASHFSGLLLLSTLLCMSSQAQPSEIHFWAGAELGNALGIGAHGSYKWVTASLQYRSHTGPVHGECPGIGQLLFSGDEATSCAQDTLRAVSVLLGVTAYDDNQRASIAIGMGQVFGSIASARGRDYSGLRTSIKRRVSLEVASRSCWAS